MLKVHPVTKRKNSVRRSPILKPKYQIGQRVELRWRSDEVPGGVDVDRGVVQGYAYHSPNYECTSRSGFAPSDGFSYCILFGGYALELANEADLFPSEEA